AIACTRRPISTRISHDRRTRTQRAGDIASLTLTLARAIAADAIDTLAAFALGVATTGGAVRQFRFAHATRTEEPICAVRIEGTVAQAHRRTTNERGTRLRSRFVASTRSVTQCRQYRDTIG